MVQVPARGAGGRPHLLFEWEGCTLADMVADAAVAVVLQACLRFINRVLTSSTCLSVRPSRMCCTSGRGSRVRCIDVST